MSQVTNMEQQPSDTPIDEPDSNLRSSPKSRFWASFSDEDNDWVSMSEDFLLEQKLIKVKSARASPTTDPVPLNLSAAENVAIAQTEQPAQESNDAGLVDPGFIPHKFNPYPFDCGVPQFYYDGAALLRSLYNVFRQYTLAFVDGDPVCTKETCVVGYRLDYTDEELKHVCLNPLSHIDEITPDDLETYTTHQLRYNTLTLSKEWYGVCKTVDGVVKDHNNHKVTFDWGGRKIFNGVYLTNKQARTNKILPRKDDVIVGLLQYEDKNGKKLQTPRFKSWAIVTHQFLRFYRLIMYGHEHESFLSLIKCREGEDRYAKTYDKLMSGNNLCTASSRKLFLHSDNPTTDAMYASLVIPRADIPSAEQCHLYPALAHLAYFNLALTDLNAPCNKAPPAKKDPETGELIIPPAPKYFGWDLYPTFSTLIEQIIQFDLFVAGQKEVV